VFFALIGPWTQATRMELSPQTLGEKARDALLLSLLIAVFVGAASLARGNIVRGRGDRRGAFRLAAVVFCLQLLLWVCRGHHVASAFALALLLAALANSLLLACLMWILYLALEPYVRRRWPQTIVSWSRLLAGRFQDALLGRDVLFGVFLGLVWALIFEVHFLVLEGLGAAPLLPDTQHLQGAAGALAAWLRHALYSVRGTLDFFFLIFVLRALLRRQWLAAATFVLLFSALNVLGADHPVPTTITEVVIYTIAVIMLLRFGLVTLAVGILTIDLLINAPATASLSAWYASSAVFAFGSILALGSWGAYTSLGGQPLWTGDLFE
jgi:serine/threonine-protein kinase